MSFAYTDEMIEFMKMNSVYKEYNPKDYIRKVDMQKELRCIVDAPKSVASIKPTAKRRKEYMDMTFENEVSYGIVLCIKNTNEDYLRQMLESVLAQTYEKFTLYIIDKSDRAHAYIANVCTDYDDSRIVYRKVKDEQSISFEYFVCDYLVFLNELDALSPFALSECTKAIDEHNADLIYSDSVIFKKKKEDIINCILRPDYSPVNLEVFNYIGDFCVVKRLNLDLTREYMLDNASNSMYDMIKEHTDFSKTIVHIRKPIYFENYAKKTKYKAVKKAYDKENKPKVSIIIKSSDNFEKFVAQINSILMLTTYDNFEIIIVENGSDSKNSKLFKYYKLLTAVKNIHFLRWKGDNNSPKIYNYAATKVDSDYLVFLDEGVMIASHDWLESLLTYAYENENALVSPRVYKKNTELVYAGALAKGDTSNTRCYPRNISMASRYCTMIARNKFFEFGGFDEKYRADRYIEDLSLKAFELMYYNVYTPYAIVSVKDVKTKVNGEDDTIFKKKWKDKIEYDCFREK